ncbi:hypothetical protein SME17J_47440 (plasmid) [Serratia marcescens]|nr:hypothetical protein SME17J_47440 [Serratia marcescens]
MKPHIDIVILDENSYFSQGLKYLLHDYFVHKGWSVTFLPTQFYTMATLLIKAAKIPVPLQYCHFKIPDKRQNIIIIQQSLRRQHRLPACMNERGIIQRSDSAEVVLNLIEKIIEELTDTSTPDCTHCPRPLTSREWEVLHTIRLGLMPSQVAEYLNLSVKTVSAHKRAAMHKLGFQRNTELYHWLLKGGLDINKRELL